MSLFELYFTLGLQHIADIRGYDHILFILVLCAVYSLREWKRVLILVTAFTVGHSLTLALATLDLIRINSDLVEFLIPLTIFITGLVNIVARRPANRTIHSVKYAAALFFGLIHGLGFSNYLRALLGSEKGLFVPLLSFNVGLEVGQILIVLVILLISLLVVDILKYPRREWSVLLSGAGLGVSLILMIERIPG